MSYKEQILTKTVFPPGVLCLAFSGGSDSLALLSLLPKERSYAVYINHNLRPSTELEKEIALNRRNAALFSIPLKVITLEKGEVEKLAENEKSSIEAAARKIRYSYLLAEGADHILTAHHMDDQAETLIMRILSSSPLYKMEGIRRERGRIFRPFLSVEKSLITSYLTEAGLEYSVDSTNADTRYKRNFIRKNILPLLSEGEKEMLSAIALNIQAINSRDAEIPIEKGFTYRFDRSKYLSSSPLRKEEALYKINSAMGFSSLLSRAECLNVDEAIKKGTSYFSPRFYLRTDDNNVWFFPRRENILFDASKSFKWKAISYELSSEAEDDRTLLIDFSEIRFPLILRLSLECDQIELKEGKKKVKDLEKEYRIPYSFVLEDRLSIVAVFARVFGKRDRIARRFLNRKGMACALKEVEIGSL